jgi:hypothetical protein
MNKRGEISYDVLINLVLASMVVVAISYYIADVATDSLFEQNFMARDIALTTDSVYAAPGDVTIICDTTLNPNVLFFVRTFPQTNFSFAFQNSNVYVFKRILIGAYSSPATYPFAESQGMEFYTPEVDEKVTDVNKEAISSKVAIKVAVQKQGNLINITSINQNE